jgi:hypothetical protein
MNVFTATRHLAFVGKLFAAAGLDLQKLISANDENALKALIATQPVAAAPADPTDEQIDTAVSAEMDEMFKLAGIARKPDQPHADAFAAHVSALNSQVTTSAALVKAFATATNVTETDPAKVAAAVTARVSVLAAEQLAKAGVQSLPEQTPAADPASAPAAVAAAAAPKVSGFERARASFAAQRK